MAPKPFFCACAAAAAAPPVAGVLFRPEIVRARRHQAQNQQPEPDPAGTLWRPVCLLGRRLVGAWLGERIGGRRRVEGGRESWFICSQYKMLQSKANVTGELCREPAWPPPRRLRIGAGATAPEVVEIRAENRQLPDVAAAQDCPTKRCRDGLLFRYGRKTPPKLSVPPAQSTNDPRRSLELGRAHLGKLSARTSRPFDARLTGRPVRHHGKGNSVFGGV
jgi:hypothetical protein